MLLAAGANVAIVNDVGETALHLTADSDERLLVTEQLQRSPPGHFRASHTPSTANAMPASARPVSVSPNIAQAISAVVGGVR